MDVKYQRKLIDISLTAANDSDGGIEDFFVKQANRLKEELRTYLLNKQSKKGKNRCSSANAATKTRNTGKKKTKSLSPLVTKPTLTRSS